MAFHEIRLIFSTNGSCSSLTNRTSPGRPGIGFCFGWARPQSVISYGTYDITPFISAIDLILALYWPFRYRYCSWPFYIFIDIISFNSTHINQVYSEICLEYNIYFQVNYMLRGDRIVFPKLKEMASWKLCRLPFCTINLSWWRYQMETFSALLVICAGNSPVNSPHRDHWPQAVMLSLISKRFSKQSWGWWFETLSPPLCRQCNVLTMCGSRVGISETNSFRSFIFPFFQLKMCTPVRYHVLIWQPPP